MQELQSTAATEEDRRRMQDILRRVHDSDDGGAALAAALGMERPLTAVATGLAAGAAVCCDRNLMPISTP